MSSKSFNDKAVSGVKWTSINQIVVQAFTFLLGVILARKLGPDDFGLIAMATVITGFANLFLEFGINNIVIQRQNPSQLFLSTAFWTNVIIGAFVSLIIAVTADLVVSFYNVPNLKNILLVLIIPFFIHSFTIVPLALLKKAIDFRNIFIIQSTSVVLAGILTLVFVYYELGYWSLVLQLVAIKVITLIVICVVTKWLPSLAFSKQYFVDIFHYSWPLLGSKLLTYTTKNVDSILIGRYLGQSKLGVYNRAYSLMYLPVNNITNVFSNVMFPTYAVNQDDKNWIKVNYLKVSRIVAFIVFPLLFTASALSKPFIIFLLGDKWLDVIPIFAIMAIVGAFNALSIMNKNIYYVLNKNKRLLKLELFIQPLKIIALVIGLEWGIIGVAIAYALATLLLEPVTYWYMGKMINLNVVSIYGNIIKVIGAAALASFVIYQFGIDCMVSFSSFVQLLTLTFCSFVIYLMILWALKSQELDEFMSFVMKTKS